jgi:hypothetical protein
VSILKFLDWALDEAETPPREEAPDFSMYEGNYEARPWGGEVAIRQWGDQLVAIDIPDDDLREAMFKLEYDGDNTFTRLTDDDDRREPWVFEIGAAGKAARVFRHSGYLSRIE